MAAARPALLDEAIGPVVGRGVTKAFLVEPILVPGRLEFDLLEPLRALVEALEVAQVLAREHAEAVRVVSRPDEVLVDLDDLAAHDRVAEVRELGVLHLEGEALLLDPLPLPGLFPRRVQRRVLLLRDEADVVQVVGEVDLVAADVRGVGVLRERREQGGDPVHLGPEFVPPRLELALCLSLSLRRLVADLALGSAQERVRLRVPLPEVRGVAVGNEPPLPGLAGQPFDHVRAETELPELPADLDAALLDDVALLEGRDLDVAAAHGLGLVLDLDGLAALSLAHDLDLSSLLPGLTTTGPSVRREVHHGARHLVLPVFAVRPIARHLISRSIPAAWHQVPCD